MAKPGIDPKMENKYREKLLLAFEEIHSQRKSLSEPIVLYHASIDGKTVIGVDTKGFYDGYLYSDGYADLRRWRRAIPNVYVAFQPFWTSTPVEFNPWLKYPGLNPSEIKNTFYEGLKLQTRSVGFRECLHQVQDR